MLNFHAGIYVIINHLSIKLGTRDQQLSLVYKRAVGGVKLWNRTFLLQT